MVVTTAASYPVKGNEFVMCFTARDYQAAPLHDGIRVLPEVRSKAGQ